MIENRFMAIKLICDTNIISEYLRGNEQIIEEIEKIGFENIAITPVIYIELLRWLSCYKGLSKEERENYKVAFSTLKVIHLNEGISVLSVGISEKINSLEPADVLIGATAIYNDLPLFTLNKKHFLPMENLELWEIE